MCMDAICCMTPYLACKCARTTYSPSAEDTQRGL